MLDGRAHRFHRTGNGLICPEIRMQLLELSYLTIRAPAQITAFSVLQVSAGNFFEPASCIEPCGNFVGNSFILYKPIRVRLADALFIELLRIDLPAFNSRLLPPTPCTPLFLTSTPLAAPPIHLSLLTSPLPHS